jgi:hypothetical protein
MKYIICSFFFFLVFNCTNEERRSLEIKNLEQGNSEEKISACNYLGKENKEKIAVSEIAKLVTASSEKQVSLSCIHALGYIGQGGNSNSALSKKILSSKDSDIQHASLYAIYEIMSKSGIELPARDAVHYSDVHLRQNLQISELVDKIKQYMKEKEK